MSKSKALLILSLLIGISYALSINSVSLLSQPTNTALTGSIMGGTNLYIEGLGFSPVMAQNTIMVGDFPCKLLDGATATSIVCQTSFPGDYKQRYNLDITVIVSGRGSVTSTKKFSYVNSATPYLYSVTPSVAFGGVGKKLFFYGVHRIFNLGADKDQGDIHGIYIGDSLCSRFGIFQDQITANGAEYIQAYQQNQKAGKFNVTQHLYPGKSNAFQLMLKADLDNSKIYHFVVLPMINDTTKTGSINGQNVILQGTGFSPNINDIKVQVDGVNCVVSQSTLSQIKCKLQKKQNQTSSQLQTNAGTPNNRYESGKGFFYKRYDISALGTKTIAKFKELFDAGTMDQTKLLQQGVRGQIRSENTYGSNIGQVFQGYFVPPVTGNYRFRGYADDYFAVYLSDSTYGSVTNLTTPLIYSNTAQTTSNYANYYQTQVTTSESGNVSLIAGKRYYMQVYHMDIAGFNRFSVSVQVPNQDTTVQRWQTYQVHTIQTNQVSDPEIMEFTSKGVTSGTYKLKNLLTNTVTLITTQQNCTLNWNASAADFCTCLGKFDFLRPYGLTCTLTMIDNDGLVTTNISWAIQFKYRVSIDKFRDANTKKRTLTSTYSVSGGNFTYITIQDHSPLIIGTFTINLGGVDIKLYDSVTKLYSNSKIPYNIDQYSLREAFRQIPGLKLTQLQRTGDPSLGARWIIYYIGYNLDLPQLLVSGAGLSGGKIGTSPTVVSKVRRDFSTNLFVDPIDYRFMSTFSSKTNFRLTVNDIPSACNGDCSYTFLKTIPILTAASIFNTNQLKLSVNNPSNITVLLTDLTITMDGKECVNLTGTLANFTCKLVKNSDNTPDLTAGDYLPIVNAKNIGIIDYASNLGLINIPLILSSVNPNNGGNNGGYKVQIIGKGFPSDIKKMNFQICGQYVNILSLTNTKAEILIPECGNTTGIQNISGIYTALQSQIPFEYKTPGNVFQISNIYPKSWSPVMKGVMNITGNGFGSNINDIHVYLTNGQGKTYQMKVLELTDILIKVGIPGGLPGDFEVNVIRTGFGYAISNPPQANDFIYECVITGIQPKRGAINGGTLITITGRNFVANTLDTMVTIGNQLNQLCKIQSITTTQIKCRTPTKNFYYNVSQQLIVLVNSKLIIDSTCELGYDCTFSFIDSDISPNLTSISSTSLSNSGILNLVGLRYTIGSSVAVSITNQVTNQVLVIPVTNTSKYNDTFISVNVPVLESGYYFVRARIDPIGESNPLELKFNLNINLPNPAQFSVQGGRVSISGVGFPQTWPNNHYNKMSLRADGQNQPLNLISISPTKIVLDLPKGYNTRSYTFSLTNLLKITKNIVFSQTDANTPTVQVNSPTSQVSSNTSVNITLNRTISPSTTPEIIQIFSISNPNYVMKIQNWTYSTTFINFSVNLTSGKYGFRLFDETLGFYKCISTLSVSSDVSLYAMNNSPISFNGDTILISGSNIGLGSIIKVEGMIGTVIQQNSSEAVFKVPRLITPESQSVFNFVKNQTLNLTGKTFFGDSVNSINAFDGDHSTIYDSSNLNCHIGVDIGQNLNVLLTRIRYFPNYKWQIASLKIKGAVFEGSNDNTTWEQIGQVDQTVHAGWNSIMINSNKTYRYFRFVHNDLSRCNLAQFQLTGILMSKTAPINVTSYITNIIFYDGLNTKTFTNALQFRQDKTPIVNSVSPKNGDVFGGYNITITGINLNLATPKVNIDGIDCQVKSSSATSIICQVGKRLNLPSKVTFEVNIGGKTAVLNAKFSYVMRWSDPRTWGTDLPPVDKDLVYVPPGMHLLVDQSTPVLQGIVVQSGTIQFADQIDMTIHTGFITVNRGQFIAGTDDDNHEHKLSFIMYGNYYGKQQPMFGNKGIGCLQCKFSMHGKTRAKTWTSLTSTINPGDNQFTVQQDVDWQVGQHIVIASTNYDHNEAQQRIITYINGRNIIVDRPFDFMHFAGTQNYGTTVLQMRAEVGLLSRNIKMMGDQTSVATDYGSHLMLAGSAQNGLVGKIAYTQFTKCGQPQIVGRYCHHFHMNGDVPQSYSIGNSVHHSMARILTLHGVHFLYVAWNVGYRVKGHNFFIQDGIETNNVLEHNLAISSLAVNNMMQTDMSVASFWITNPTNHIRNNHAAGSDFYGFWYQIKQRPDGPSATQDICPIGNPLGQSHDNVAHSNVRFGLRIFKLYSRQNPCQDIRNDRLQDPWSENPSIQSRFYNYVLYKNGEAGLLAQQTGHTVFENFVIAESGMAGMQFYKNNFTKEDVKALNFTIIGRSVANPPANNSKLAGSKGVILPRTGSVYLENIRFYQFTNQMTVWQSCSKCDHILLYTNFGASYWAKQISYNNINGSYYFMKGLKRQIFYDEDGSLTGTIFNSATRTRGTITFGFPHLLQNSACSNASNLLKWNNAAVCDSSVIVRQVMFSNLVQKQQFKSISIKARQLNSISDVTQKNETYYTSVFSLQKDMQPKKQNKFTYSLPYITGQIYNIWWGTGIDFKHVSMVTSYLYKDNQSAIIFKFNYTDNRQLYQVGPHRGGILPNISQLLTPSLTALDKTVCTNGQYFHDNSNGSRQLHLCASGKNKWRFEYTDITAIYCRYLCPAPPGSCTKQAFVRLWTNTTQWPSGRLPNSGQNVSIPCEWTIKMNMNPQPMDYFQINGDIFIEDTMDINITAKNIWIKSGSIKAGTSSDPFTHLLIFQLNGDKDASGFTVDPLLTGNKMFVVTGNLQLYGVAPTTVSTRLTAFASKGANTISVISTSGWKIGDQIGIAPSFSSALQFQKVTITALTSTTVTFTPALQYNHYGDSSATITKSYGILDTRTGIAHLTRNIKITAGPDSGWGFTFVQYGYNDLVDNKTIVRTGKVQMIGVQFINGGQYDTQQAALQIFNVRLETNMTVIKKSSFHGCQDFCMKIQNAYNIQITNNVFFKARKYHVRALQIYKFSFLQNLMIGVTKRPTTTFKDLIACYGTYSAVDTTQDMIKVHGNTCQGSQGHGYLFPHVPCADQELYPFADNTAGSTEIAFILERGQGECLAVKGFYAYASLIGLMHNPVGTVETRFKNFIMADNERSITIRIGGRSQQKVGYLEESYITAISRPNCSQCYGQMATDCTDTHGIRMLTTGSNGQNLPDKFGHGYDVVCKQQTIDGKVFIYNTEFNNFKQTYSNLPQCSSNVIFKPHPGGSDIIGSHHLFNTNCSSCELKAYAYFSKPSDSELGWFGGCGSILCTGMNNYLIHDHSGTFLPTKGVLLANNSWIGNGQDCQFISEINGYYCTNQDFGVLQYESIAPDFNTRIMWPVYLKYDGGNWTSQTNGWKQWHWNGGQPLNNRIGRFVSTVRLHKMYNMTFTSMPPEDMTLKIQKRLPTGNSSDWVIVKLYYPKPNSIRIQVNGQIIKPTSLLDSNAQKPLNTSLCGSNKFFYTNYTIHFVVTGDAKCKVRVSLTNSIQLTARFAMDINNFFNSDGQTRFINRMAALLQINDTSRIKIVGIYAGSVIITTFIDEEPVPIENSTSTDPKKNSESTKTLHQSLTNLVKSGAVSSAFANEPGFGNLLSVTSQVIQVKPDSELGSTSNDNTAMIIGIVLGSTFIVCITIIASVCYMRKRAKIGHGQHNQIPFESSTHKQGDMNKIVSHDNFSLVDLRHQKKQIY